MRYIWQHIITIIESYDNGLPLAAFLKNYCKQHPKLGSRDRKMLANMAYSWYRCSKAIAPDSLSLQAGFEMRMKACLQACGIVPDQVLFREVDDRPFQHHLDRMLPSPPMLSPGITLQDWFKSMLAQPMLFIRVRKDRKLIIHLLSENNIPFTEMEGSCLALPNGAKIDSLLPAASHGMK